MKGEPWRVSRETVRRIRQQEGLQVVQRTRKRRPVGMSPMTPTRAEYPNHVWFSDVVHDQTTDGRRWKCLTILAEYPREGLAMHGARSIPAAEVIQVFQRLCASRGAPGSVKSDHGPECIAQEVTTWLHAPHVDTPFIDPGSPWQYGPNASFNGVFRDGCLNRWRFMSVQAARRIIHHWLEEDNNERPHGARDGLTPRAFAAQCSRQCLVQAA